MKIFNNMSKEKAQRVLFITVLVLVFSVFFISLSLLGPKDDGDKDPIIDDPDKDPIVEEPKFETIHAPHGNQNIEVVRKFWSLDKSTEDQETSVIKYGSEYYLSKGVSYTSENKEFNVIASLSGTVKEVTDSPIYGKTVVIKHDKGIQTEYMSLGNATVKVGDIVEQGDVIGVSGTNEYDQDALNHVHFKISVNGKYCDPELLIGKAINKITE